ncbi:MAG: DUF4332 domain-containing protein [Pirellulaceae bacterium]|jgi:energy-coupling factor transporter ATP-binding protein EcfA2/predicted flap endonuclease-1-like 5' DNA nuclease
MQLVNMDVERHGSLGPFSLGPLSPGLNALCGPAGSGKTTLLSWLRQLAEEDHQRGANGLRSTWSRTRPALLGSVEVANRGLRFRLGGHSSVPRGHSHSHYAYDARPLDQAGTNLTARQLEAFAAMASTSPALNLTPHEALAGIESGLEITAQRLGLDAHPARSYQHPDREHLLARQRDIESRLQHLSQLQSSREILLSRRDDLQRELQNAHSNPQVANAQAALRYEGYPSEYRRYGERFALIEADLRESETRLAELDRELASLQAELKLLETSRHCVTVDDSYRVQLQQIDERLTRWRQTLRDLKGHRNHIEHEATDARLDRQVGDQLSATKEPDPRAPLRSLEAQILSARNQLDALVDRYSVFQDQRGQGTRRGYGDGRSGYAVHQDTSGRTHIAYTDNHYYPDSSNLPDTLRSMQKDLYEACQQLARHESRAATETLKQQSQQLQRCESELLHSVEKLIEERAALLRKIADQYQLSAEQLSLAFGDWCNCHDHNHLHDWLLSEADIKTSHTGADPLARQRLLEKISGIELQRKQVTLHCEGCRRQLRDAELHRVDLVDRRADRHLAPRGRMVDEIQRELHDVLAQLDQWEDRERLLREAEDLRLRLTAEQPVQDLGGRFRELVHRHIAGLMGGRERFSSRAASRNVSEGMQRRYDLVDGIVYDQERRLEIEVPSSLVRVAQRLAIAEAMAARAEPVPVLIDEALDRLAHDEQAAAIAYLARIAAGQQIVLMTGNERVAELVRQRHGWVAYLQPHVAPAVDINRHLTALANDYEAAKWFQPNVDAEPLRSTSQSVPFYLTERSRIEQSPSIDGVLAARLRAIGVDRIGDLLDVDPRWLAEQLRQDGVNDTTISSWQAEARLLCSVRQLRPFDARLLVSIGVRTPQQLADMHPSQLLDRVERFVATDRGRRFLRSGSSYELSRITNWIASAKGGAGRFQGSSFEDQPAGSESSRNGYESAHNSRRGSRRSASNGSSRRDAAWNGWTDTQDEYNSQGEYEQELRDGYPADYDRDPNRNYPRRTRSDARQLAPGDVKYDDDFNTPRRESTTRRTSDREGSSRRQRRSSASSRTGRSRSSDRSSPDYSNLRRSKRSTASSDRKIQPVVAREERSERRSRPSLEREVREPRRTEAIKLAETTPLKFYLELASPVVDAPSIGPRMAARLEALGIFTVDQLLAANAESLTDKLNLRRVDATTVRAWQEQARLVCRIPNMRGHDAQLLVACDLTSPEELATMQAASVLAQVLVVAESSEGQRILRGSKQPDLAEVKDWIEWASQCRSLNAA